MNRKVIMLVMIIAIACALNGCRYGVTVESFPPARTPKGVTGTITTDRGKLAAELIEVRDDGIVILTARMFRLLPYNAIVSSRFDGIGRDRISGHRAPSAKVREQLRLVSRFPYGLTSESLQKLLSANGQTELATDKP